MVALATFAKAGYAGNIGLLILAIIFNYFVAMAEEQNKAERNIEDVIETNFVEVIPKPHLVTIETIKTINFDFHKLSKSFLKWHAKRHRKYKAKLAFKNALDSIAETSNEEIEVNFGINVADVDDIVAEESMPNVEQQPNQNTVENSSSKNKNKMRKFFKRKFSCIRKFFKTKET
ncbi:hypothetical protein JTE90_019806 [Oedothorax gibbosus]|uniref:Uncharacterized protein n=1 Tax=Oedothorax gibbosus TaxID=931172 RepID=A0AAV6V6N4_9ARAC|nr:hypothetical protein JTE90_019806 [Oedothorax gibbosus]